MKRFSFKRTNTGQVVILAVLFFTAISMIVVLGFVLPTVREIAVAKNLVSGETSYFVSEAGVEDVLYRLKTGKQVSASETFSIGDAQVVVNTADSFNGKIVEAEGDNDGYVRKIQAEVTQGVGVAFNYGLQAGNGGFFMSNNSGIIGNVYSNGDITGSNGVYITGTAIAANSAAITADQENDSVNPPANSIIFGNNNSTQDVAQSFRVSQTTNLNKVALFLRKTGSPANLTVRIVSDNSGVPSTNSLTTGTLRANLVTTSYGWIEVTFNSNPLLTAGTTYWLVLDGSTRSSKYYMLAANQAYPNGVAKVGSYGGTWVGTSPTGLDGAFKIYLGGLFATIDNVKVGTSGVGDAWAHTITNSIVEGGVYCQVGSGNNKGCDTSKPDPVPEAYPVSDGNIDQWKTDAASGAVYNGDFVLNSATASLGPTSITGDLLVANNGTVLTVDGTLWVQGDLSLSNNATIRLNPAYGTNSGVIVVDGKISISNNAQLEGSGQAGSYILLLTTSDCPTNSSCGGAPAMSIANNAGTVILNAQKGSVSLANNSGANEVTGYKITMGNGTVVTYESGLADLNFSSGPSGGWNVTRWEEVQ